MGNHKIIIYTSPTCHWCEKIKEYFVKNNVKYDEANVAGNSENALEMVDKSGQMGVPVVDIDGEIIIGFNKEKIEEALTKRVFEEIEKVEEIEEIEGLSGERKVVIYSTPTCHWCRKVKEYFDENNTYASESETWGEEQFQIELNAASFEDLMRINGVGPATAKAIIKYRELLGGYYSAQQLLDVYHIDSTNYTQISNFLTINPDSIHKININKAGYYDLKKHPYIGKALAYEIEQYRSMKGNFKTVEAVINVKGMNEDLYRKIYIYFAISDD